MSHSDELSLFQEMMGDIKPITQDTVLPTSSPHKANESQQARKEAAQALAETDSDYLSLDTAILLQPDDVIEYKRDGMQDGVYRKVRLGKYDIQARLDLHKRTLKQARDEILHFLKQCQKMDIRFAVIVHGKGAKSNPPALIKSHVAQWLPQIKEVMCVHSAKTQHGGTGAVYVLLRKSEAKKLDNREKHQKRSS
ncbi:MULTISPECIES: DNA endonuclease SmrA [Aliivibrio]|uniref:DNA endonuclease SmrA n=1 Tax=Aliivibrio finisterrensis TaxID=511998 RepID=A0A4V1Z7Z6_9GAMM|nr:MULTISPECIES: DNA endonuclease SmrA [Aliivibrio]MDD9173254.1 DNA endonuclease SmrA [Aliivibrio sp. S3TY1]MDD9180531.1 DNA endonuclease SmrA [Aliivibrio sp. A6]MDD9190330.1 DNA endonuclease SmrA [Aliivibrio sp. S2TY2]RYU47140.1 DNA endonuclease SmrA [Aliivibrio finisterrensis]RYU48264.1 DNA endonuclease SmrA [Aliivibrio finisterrensis]